MPARIVALQKTVTEEIDMEKIKIASIIVASLISVGVMAEGSNSNKVPGGGPNPYKDCGIGAALFPDTSWAAVSSNTIWDLGATALTSATASPETCKAQTVQAATFIFDTYDSLAEETARGEGEHLTSLLNILESDVNDRASIIAEVRSGMAEQVSTTEYDSLDRIEKATIYYNLITKAASNS